MWYARRPTSFWWHSLDYQIADFTFMSVARAQATLQEVYKSSEDALVLICPFRETLETDRSSTERDTVAVSKSSLPPFNVPALSVGHILELQWCEKFSPSLDNHKGPIILPVLISKQKAIANLLLYLENVMEIEEPIAPIKILIQRGHRPWSVPRDEDYRDTSWSAKLLFIDV